jgi:hypothetical protein
MGVVVFGASGTKPAGKGVFWYFGGGELETTDLGSGIGVRSSCIPTLMVLGAYVLGFYLRMEDMSSPRSETEWANCFTGLYVHTTSRSAGLGLS